MFVENVGFETSGLVTHQLQAVWLAVRSGAGEFAAERPKSWGGIMVSKHSLELKHFTGRD